MVCSAAMGSLHSVSSSATVTGLVHKSRGDNTVRMRLQLKKCFMFSFPFLIRGFLSPNRSLSTADDVTGHVML